MSTGDFRVADISLADFGRKEIELAEHEVCFCKKIDSGILKLNESLSM